MIVRTVKSTPHHAQNEVAAQALTKSAAIFAQTGEEVEELDAYDTIIELFGITAEPALQVLVANAMFSKASRLAGRGIEEERERLKLYERIVHDFQATSGSQMRDIVHRAAIAKVKLLNSLGKTEPPRQDLLGSGTVCLEFSKSKGKSG